MEEDEIRRAKEQRKLDKERQRERDQVLAAIMDLPAGRRFIWTLFEECGLFGNPFGLDVNLSYFAGGQQNVAKRIFADILRVCPEHWLTAVKEHEIGRRTEPEPDAGADSEPDPGT